MEKPPKKIKEKLVKKVKISEKSKPLKKRKKEEAEEETENLEDDEDTTGDEINNINQKIRDGPSLDSVLRDGPLHNKDENVKLEAITATASISPQLTEEDNSTCDSVFQTASASMPTLVPPTLVDMRNHYQQLYPGWNPMMTPEMYQQRTFRPFQSTDLGPAASGSQQNF